LGKIQPMAALKKGRYAGQVRPFIILSPDEDKLVAHAAIDADLSKSEWLKRAALYCVRHKIDLSDNSK
jgi:hypothetical protein